MEYKIHPAIGIARVGSSSEFFIGPERPFELANRGVTFKDFFCRIKRQAVRFRIFEHRDDGTSVDVTARAQITWTVRVKNRKSTKSFVSGASFGGTEMDSGIVEVTGLNDSRPLNASVSFDGGVPIPVSLGEVRTDASGCLIFLGGSGIAGQRPGNTTPISSTGSSGWYDDTCDGYVQASMTLDGEIHPVTPAWVVAAPPKFAVHHTNVVTMYDKLFDLAALGVGQPTSYQYGVRPILQRAYDARYLTSIPDDAHDWPDLGDFSTLPPARRQAIVDRLKPAGDMPALENLQLTATQLKWMQEFADSGFVPDSLDPPTHPAITAEGLDRAALDDCIGGAFGPGVEIAEPVSYWFPSTSDPFRVPSDYSPGRLTFGLPVPWHGDAFGNCASYWPIIHPGTVRSSTGARVDWNRLVSSTDIPGTWDRVAIVAYDEISGEFREQDCRIRLREIPPLRPRAWRWFPPLELIRRVIDIVSDPSPIDFLRLARLGRQPIARATDPDLLTRLAQHLEHMSEAELRSAAIDVQAQAARLEVARQMIDEQLRKRR